ncbi:MAG TPA: DUF3347 domain-containing protein [Mucilaginibacter sp.]|jgi:hypothetical protein
MKTIKIILLSLAFLAILKPIKAQNATASAAVNTVVTAYLEIKNALTIDNNELAKTKAKELLTAISVVPADKLTTDQKTLWTAYANKLNFYSRHISESTAIDHQRDHFTSLSKNMFEVVKGLKLNTATIYEQYCPMKKATWLSETSTIKNPYYGKQMLTCGKTTETLAPATK